MASGAPLERTIAAVIKLVTLGSSLETRTAGRGEA